MGFFFLLWALAGMISATTARADDPSEVAGSSASFETFVESVYASEETKIDRPVSAGDNPVSAAVTFANAAAGWVSYMFQSAALISPIWEGWAGWIRYLILVLQVPLIIQVLLEGAKVLSGFIPFT